LVFITRTGASWNKGTIDKIDHEKGTAKGIVDNPVNKEFTKLLKELKLHRPGRNFYALRHVFRTVADECRDTPAIDHIMGHEAEGMATV
jgi:hypothetical protein